MNDEQPEQLEERVLVLAPTARDGATSQGVLEAVGVRYFLCSTIEDVCREARRGAGAAVVTAEAALGDKGGCLSGWLKTQPPWSDFPLVVLTPSGADSPKLLGALEAVGHMTLMKRPVQISTLLSTVRSALRDRRRQYALRDLLEARMRAEEDLRRLAADLAEADRRKTEFLAMLAHELRNPLAPIRNSLQLVRVACPRPQQEVGHAYDIIERQVEHLVRLVDDLLDVSRITSGKINLQKERVDLAAVVSRAVEGARPLIDTRRHTLEVKLPEDVLTVEVDPVRLAQVLWNLLNNAAKYTPEGGRIWLTVVQEQDKAAVRVRDTGLGIPVDMLSRVFDLFTQMERTRARAEGGLGIGLTLVRRLTEMHDGTVEAFSGGPGQGSEFVVRLPIAENEILSVKSPGSSGADQRAGLASGKRILVVDDNRDSAESLAMLLRLFGNDVRMAHDGRLALEVATSYRPDVVLLDIGLPGLDGLEVCRRLRKQSKETQPLIVAMTGYGQEEDRRQSEEAGFNAHLVKPVDLGALQDLLSGPELVRRVPS